MTRPSESERGKPVSGHTRAEQPKRPYRSPRLTIYGNIGRIAMAKGGVKNDGGPSSPATKF